MLLDESKRLSKQLTKGSSLAVLAHITVTSHKTIYIPEKIGSLPTDSLPATVVIYQVISNSFEILR